MSDGLYVEGFLQTLEVIDLVLWRTLCRDCRVVANQKLAPLLEDFSYYPGILGPRPVLRSKRPPSRIQPQQHAKRLRNFLTFSAHAPLFLRLDLSDAPASLLETGEVQRALKSMTRLLGITFPWEGWSDVHMRNQFTHSLPKSIDSFRVFGCMKNGGFYQMPIDQHDRFTTCRWKKSTEPKWTPLPSLSFQCSSASNLFGGHLIPCSISAPSASIVGSSVPPKLAWGGKVRLESVRQLKSKRSQPSISADAASSHQHSGSTDFPRTPQRKAPPRKAAHVCERTDPQFVRPHEAGSRKTEQQSPRKCRQPSVLRSTSDSNDEPLRLDSDSKMKRLAGKDLGTRPRCKICEERLSERTHISKHGGAMCCSWCWLQLQKYRRQHENKKAWQHLTINERVELKKKSLRRRREEARKSSVASGTRPRAKMVKARPAKKRRIAQ